MADAESRLLVSFSETERSRALEKFYSIKPFLEGQAPLTVLSRQQNIPLRTMRRRVKQYRAHGLSGLIRSKHSGKACKYANPELIALIEGLALRSPGRTSSSIWREVCKFCAAENWPLPTYTAVYRTIRKLHPQLITLAHAGTKAYKEKFDLIYRRECSRPNEIWQADHTELDLWLLDEKNNRRRPWLTVILDDYSRSVCGYYLSFEAPNTLRTALTLRQAIWRKSDPRWHVFGIPDVFYTDNGSDFTSKHMEQVSADIRMELVFSTKGYPRGRGKMERFFGTVNELFLCHLQGYMSGKEQSKPTLTLAELNEQFHEWLLTDYMVRTHSEIDGSPQQRWTENAFIPRTVSSLEHLDLLLLMVATPRRVLPDGIHFQCLRYTSPTLAAYVGDSVVIRYDPRDMAEIRVFHKDAFLCRAVCPALESQTVTLQEIVKARNARTRELRREITSRQTVVSRYIQVHMPTSDVQPSVPATAEAPVNKLRRYYSD